MKSTCVCISNSFQFHNAILTLEVISSNGEMFHYDMTKNINTIKWSSNTKNWIVIEYHIPKILLPWNSYLVATTSDHKKQYQE